MSRAKSRTSIEVCGDCGAPDATWASINKGILLCTQCCAVHRRLGRHISQVKSLQKSTWNAFQLNMVYALNNNGANNIWEYNLLENSGKLLKKKPNPKDPLKIKHDYIITKHEKCAFAFRGDDTLLNVEGCENELGKQLHASVRSPNLETSFRLLVQGADPNYFHDEKGSTPLHVAVKHGQKLQLELLLVFGADPEGLDNHGQTPINLAKSINSDLLERLIENQYEVTDALIEYLAHRKPDHGKGIHFHIPSVAFESNPAASNKLQKMRNSDFEELVMDVFDEVDRRQTDAIWLSCVDALELTCIPFLPSNCKLSSTRNQGRQKLATFSTPELKSLVYDILVDTQRRQMFSFANVNHLKPNHARAYSQLSIEDDPLYDSVASDDESIKSELQPKITPPPIEINNQQIEKLTKKLQQSDSTINELKIELLKLKSNFDDLKYENIELKTRLSQRNSIKAPHINGESLHVWAPKGGAPTKGQRPMSMLEHGELSKIANSHPKAPNSTQSLHENQFTLKETVLECTELITRGIQHLLKNIQNGDNVSDGGEKVRRSVTSLANILRDFDDSKSIKMMLGYVPRLLQECNKYDVSLKTGADIDPHLIKIRDCAFHLAMHTKEIVTKYSSKGGNEGIESSVQ